MLGKSLYWIIILVSFLYLIIKYRKNLLFIFFILFFFEGLFTNYGPFTWNFYKIFLFGFSVVCLFKYQQQQAYPKQFKSIVIFFIIFIALFTISAIFNKDPVLLFLNQFSKYFYTIVALSLFYSFYYKYSTLSPINELVKQLLIFQILFSVINFGLMGLHEDTVGSISSNGGSAATVIPVLGIIWYWHYKKGFFIRKDWLLIIGLLFIGFVSYKRAIWIVAPIFIFLLLYWVPKKRINPKLLLLIPLVPVIFYLGVRLNPTLNKENKVWGSFDFDYFYNYSRYYTFGSFDSEENTFLYGNGIRKGRGGATLLTFERIIDPNTPISFLGNGLNTMYAYDENAAENPNSPIKIEELNSVTMATGFFQNYYTGGILLVVSFWLFMFSLFSIIKNKRLLVVIVLYFLWEYFLYANITMRTPATSFLFVFIILQLSLATVQHAKAPHYLP